MLPFFSQPPVLLKIPVLFKIFINISQLPLLFTFSLDLLLSLLGGVDQSQIMLYYLFDLRTWLKYYFVNYVGSLYICSM